MDEVFDQYRGSQPYGVSINEAQVYNTHKEVWDYFLQVSQKPRVTSSVRGIVKSRVEHLRSSVRHNGNSANTVARNTQLMKESIPTDVRQYAARLARLLLSQEDRRKEGGHRSGKLDARRLAQIKAGNANVFARNNVTKTAETRIMIAVDGSSSMTWVETVCAILALNGCLGRANVKFDIVEWGGLSYNDRDSRFGDHNWLVYHKKSSDNWRKIDTEIDFQPVGGDTPTYACMMQTARIMSEWQEPRRVLLFLTDGWPNGYNPEVAEVGKLVNNMRKGGLETYGVFIGGSGGGASAWMEEMFGDQWTDTEFSELGKTLLGGIEKLLLKQGHAHAA